MILTYCGKNCEECGRLNSGECEGCLEVWQECEIANCCWKKGFEECSDCTSQNDCPKLNQNACVPKTQEKDCGQEEGWQEVPAEKEKEFERRAPILGQWLWVLFCLSISGVVLGFLNTGSLASNLPAVSMVIELVRTICSLAYGIILLKLASEEKGYRAAGLCSIAAVVISLTLGRIPVLGVIAQLVASVVTLIEKYWEYKTHAAVTAEVNPALSKSWSTLWKVYIIAMVMTILSLVLMIGIVGVVLAVLAAYFVLVLGIMEIWYLFRTARIFRQYSTN